MLVVRTYRRSETAVLLLAVFVRALVLTVDLLLGLLFDFVAGVAAVLDLFVSSSAIAVFIRARTGERQSKDGEGDSSSTEASVHDVSRTLLHPT